MNEEIVVVVPWHSRDQRAKFCEAWGVEMGREPDYLLMQRDEAGEGCGVTKNRGVHAAVADRLAQIVVVLDDDCFPFGEVKDLPALMRMHKEALSPQPVTMFEAVTDPPSRGTPYFRRTLTMPVAASMGFWVGVGDYDAVGQLAHGATHAMEFRRGAVFGRYFPLCGMNLAFRPAEWWPWWQFIDVPRFDDIWQGLLWQKEAYRRRHCFNLCGPTVRHSRQSNVWANLRDEAVHLEANEDLWVRIALSTADDYETLRGILPV